MVNQTAWIIGGGILGAVMLYYLLTGIFRTKKSKDISYVEATKEFVKTTLEVEQRIDKDAGQFHAAKSLGGQPLFYNEVDHSIGRFLSTFRTESDMADQRIIHNNCYRVRYLKDVKYLGLFKASREEVTPCVFRPGIDLVFKSPGEEPGIPSEGIVVLKRSMDGQRLGHGDNVRLRSMIQIERSQNKMLADMLIMIQDKKRLAHMDPTSKEYTEDMINMLKRTKQIHDAASGRRDEGSGFSNPYAQEMYGAEDTTPQSGAGEDGLWKLG